MNLLQERKHHERKLAIIEMIEICTERIRREKSFLRNYEGFLAFSNTKANIDRHVTLREYLIQRYEKA